MGHATWMSECAAIQDRRLRHICLPASHDSGTYALGDTMAADAGSGAVQVLTWINDVARDIADIPGIGAVIPNPARWVMDAVVPAIRAVSATTALTVLEQLRAGIRCLDLRVYADLPSGRFFVWHGLVGPSLQDILSDVATFLESSPGELVYLTLGHGRTSDPTGKAAFPYDALWREVEQHLGRYAFAPSRSADGGTSDNVFEHTLAEILAATPARRGAAVLVNGSGTGVTSPSAWPRAFSPPDNGSGTSPLNGSYTDTSDLAVMVADQQRKLGVRGNSANALYLTLTPQQGEVIAIMAASLSSAVTEFAKATALVNPAVAILLESFALGLKAYQLTLDWTSIEGLSDRVSARMASLLANEFSSGDTAGGPGLVYADYVENSPLVDLCIAVNTGEIRQFAYLFQYGADRRYCFTQQIIAGGFMGKEVGNAHWKLPYSELFPYVAADGASYLFGFGAAEKNWFIQRLLPGGGIGTEASSGKWKNVYSPLLPVTVGKDAHVFGLNPSNNHWFIQSLLPGGQLGPEMDQGTWKNFYAVMCPLVVAGRSYLFGLNKRNNHWFIQEVLPGGRLAKDNASEGRWNNSYDPIVPVTVAGPQGPEVYLFGLDGDKGNAWFLQRVLPGGQLSPTESDRGRWGHHYPAMTAVCVAGRSYLFGYNRGNRYWFLQQVLPGGRMGPEARNPGSTWGGTYDMAASFAAPGKAG